MRSKYAVKVFGKIGKYIVKVSPEEVIKLLQATTLHINKLFINKQTHEYPEKERNS